MGKKQTTKSQKAIKRKRNPWLRLLIRLSVVAVVLLTFFSVWKNWEKIAPESVLDWAAVRFGDAQVGNGFPTPMTGNSVVAMGEVNHHLAVLTDTTLEFFNNTASRVEKRQHSFSNPALKTAGRYALTTEIGGTRFRLDTRRETVLTKDFENRSIYTSSLLPSGMVAVVTDSASQSYLCGIQVFNARGKQVYEYQCRRYLINNICLYPSGNGLAAVGTCSEGGALKSVLLLFDFDKEEPQEYSGTDVLLLDVNCFSSGVISAVGDSQLWIYRPGKKEPEKVPYNGYEPAGYTATSSLAGLVLRRSGGTGESYIWTVDNGGEVWKSEGVEGRFRSASCEGNELLVLTDSHLHTFGKKNHQQKQEVPTDSLLVTKYRNAPLLLTLSHLQRTEG